MNEDSPNLQNDFFGHARKEHNTVAIFLMNGKRLVGRIKSFDRFTLLLSGTHGDLMLFKHAISTVSITGDSEAWAHPDDEAARHDASESADRPAAQGS